jgi:hypothetical protein
MSVHTCYGVITLIPSVYIYLFIMHITLTMSTGDAHLKAIYGHVGLYV